MAPFAARGPPRVPPSAAPLASQPLAVSVESWLSRISGKAETLLKQSVAPPSCIYNNVEPG
jgi:hypothetical protein